MSRKTIAKIIAVAALLLTISLITKLCNTSKRTIIMNQQASGSVGNLHEKNMAQTAEAERKMEEQDLNREKIEKSLGLYYEEIDRQKATNE